MPQTFTPETRQLLLTQLNDALHTQTVQTLRLAARGWGWPLRGVAKMDIVNQVMGYLADPQRMAEAVLTLPDETRAILGWLSALNPINNPGKTLQQVLLLTSGRQMTQKAVNEQIMSLQERCLVFLDATNRYIVPALFLEWLPAVEAPRLRYAGPQATITQFTLTAFNQHIEHLLSNIEADQPVVASDPPISPATYSPAERLSGALVARPGLVPPETLGRWDYLTQEERALAGFLLEQLANMGLCGIELRGNSQRLKLMPANRETWEALTPTERLYTLRQRWLAMDPQRGPAAIKTWNELDLALPRTQPYTLRSSYYWSGPEAVYLAVGHLRIWLVHLVERLAPDTWHSVDGLCQLVYQIERDPFGLAPSATTWRWYRDKVMLDPQQMPYELWRDTYGRLVEAWLTGPMSWLLFAQVGYEGGRPVSFRILREVPVRDAQRLPADALQFPSETIAVLRNSWQTGGLRQLLRRMAVETARSRESTTYRLDVATFRRTVQAGGGAQPLAEAFKAAGFPLPAATEALLRTWQSRAGRYQLYDHVGVIEFNEEMHPEEARAIAGLGSGQFYQASPHCLVVLNPDAVQGIITELRRRGYTPQVTS